MNYKIGIIITSFLRDKLLYQTVQNIVDIYPKNCTVFIGNQSYQTDDEKINGFSDFNINIDNRNHMPMEYYNLPYDCGLSYARNFLIQKAYESECNYILLLADSIQFNQDYNFQPYINFLEKDNKRGLIGFELNGSKCCWEFLMDITPQGIKLNSSHLFITEDNITYKKCEICRNIFLAKTESVLNLWDNEMKLAEHELAFLEYKKRGYNVFWTDSISFNKVKDSSLETYNQLRNRFGDYRNLLKKKLNINGWVIYSPEAMREIKEYKEKHEEKI